MKKEHIMNLNDAPFRAIKSGKKTVEMRLYDEKRQQIHVADRIVFTNISTGEQLSAVVEETAVFKDFASLYACYDKEQIGYEQNQIADPKDMNIYYPEEKIRKYGAFAIRIRIEQ